MILVYTREQKDEKITPHQFRIEYHDSGKEMRGSASGSMR